jgi:large subunit ribosomal protein L24
VPLPLSHVRLVIPSEITKGAQKIYKDVIVEKIFMERHTTGIDPYTGTDYGSAEIPKHHQYDPSNGLPIFHRYIAGTQHRLEWPWERKEDVEDAGVTEEEGTDNQTKLRKFMGGIVAPRDTFRRWRESRNKDKEIVEAEKGKTPTEEFMEIEEAQAKKEKKAEPKAKDSNAPDAYDGVDTTRNIVQGSESVAYTLVHLPFPDTLGDELRTHIHDYNIEAKREAKKDPEASPFIKIGPTSKKRVLAMEKVREEQRMRMRAAEAMKTPMQLRWELEQRRKVEKSKREPLVDEESLLVALGEEVLGEEGICRADAGVGLSTSHPSL